MLSLPKRKKKNLRLYKDILKFFPVSTNGESWFTVVAPGPFIDVTTGKPSLHQSTTRVFTALVDMLAAATVWNFLEGTHSPKPQGTTGPPLGCPLNASVAYFGQLTATPSERLFKEPVSF